MHYSLFDELVALISNPWIIKLIVAAIILITAKMVVKGLNPVIRNMCQRNNLDQHTCHIIHKVVRHFILTLGVVIALQNLGLDFSMLIAAFGITGIVLSYGMRDIVANFIAGILIMGFKHIKINDVIKVQTWEGKVVDINLRYTTLNSNTTTIIIPNIVLYTEIVGIVKNS